MRDSEGRDEVVFVRGARCDNGACVEIARLADGQVLLRDSKDRSRAPLVFTSTEWEVFTQAVRDGEFDLHRRPGPTTP